MRVIVLNILNKGATLFSPKVEVLRLGHPDFPRFWKSLSDLALVSPIYGDAHTPLFQCISGHRVIRRFDRLALVDGRPVAGLRLNLAEDNEFMVLDYFGHPGCIIALPGETNLNPAFSALSLTMLEDGFLKSISTHNLQTNISISSEWTLQPTKLMQIVLRRSSKLRIAFSKYFDLGAPDIDSRESIEARCSKSVKQALKSTEAGEMVCISIDASSDQVDIDTYFLELKALHLLSAGRHTHSGESWKIMRDSIFEGHAFLVAANLANKTIGASYYHTSGQASYYAMSAIHPDYRTLSTGHVIMVEAIDFARKNSINTFWLGSQFTNITGEATTKEKQIELFKSYFGNSMSLLIVATREHSEV